MVDLLTNKDASSGSLRSAVSAVRAQQQHTKVGLHLPPLSPEADANAYTAYVYIGQEGDVDLLELDFTQIEFSSSAEQHPPFPLVLFDMIRTRWSSEKLLGVRIVAPGHVEAVLDDNTLLDVAQYLKEQGCDIISVVANPYETKERRLCQRLLSDRIRNEVRIATMIVGDALNADEINTNILAARADLCLLNDAPGLYTGILVSATVGQEMHS